MTLPGDNRTTAFDWADSVPSVSKLIEAGRIDEARAMGLELAQHASSGTVEASDLGNLLFRLGEMSASGRTLAAEANLGTASPEALRNLSALLHTAGDFHTARQLLIEAAQRDPLKGLPIRDTENPVLLRLVAIHQSYYRIKRDRIAGLFLRSLQRGHFSATHFIDQSRFNVVVVSLSGPHLPSIDALPKPDLIVNSAACADLNPSGLGDVARFVEHFPEVPLINPPDRVLSTTRTGNASRLSGIDGVTFPQTVNFRRPPDPKTALDMLRQTRIGSPLILRQAGTQTGRTMELCENDMAVLRYIEAQPIDQLLVATQYQDARDVKGRYRKLRVFFINGTMYPVVDLRSDHWNIHSADRYRIMADDLEAQEAELHFLRVPEAVLGAGHMDRLAKIAEIIDLDFFGIDFSPLPDGRLLIFEANAAMRHNYEHLERFPYRKPFLDNISNAFDRMLVEKLDAGKRC
ncbi:MAG: hypothetical protein ABNH38_16120 [Tateyamaria sp.]|jgi:hypothetical protein|uniref:hypothetical protein n=1 Tax=Tateyamaria sp. TaxID=1929288 RepID=UPI0032DD33F9